MKNKTPLQYALEKNSNAMGEVLILNGADITVKDIIFQRGIIIVKSI